MSGDTGTSSSLAQLLALISGQSGPQQYPVGQAMDPRMYGPSNQTMQPVPQGIPANVAAMWASMTPDMRAQYMAAMARPAPQLASAAGMPASPPPTRLSLTPDLLSRYAALQPQVQYGDPLTMRPNSDMIDNMQWRQGMNDLANIGR